MHVLFFKGLSCFVKHWTQNWKMVREKFAFEEQKRGERRRFSWLLKKSLNSIVLISVFISFWNNRSNLDLDFHWVSRYMHLTKMKHSDWLLIIWIINEFEDHASKKQSENIYCKHYTDNLSLNTFTICWYCLAGNAQQPVPGSWSPFGAWSECSKSCGRGVLKRNRTCSTAYCEGNPEESQTCNVRSCEGRGPVKTF